MKNKLIYLAFMFLMSLHYAFATDDNNNAFVCTQSATAPNAVIARQKALLHARNFLATMVNGKVKNVSENYINHNSLTGESVNEFITETQTTASVLLSDVEVADESVVKEKKNKYTVYVTLKLDKKKVLNSLCKNILKNKSLSNNFDEKEFTKEWNKDE